MSIAKMMQYLNEVQYTHTKRGLILDSYQYFRKGCFILQGAGRTLMGAAMVTSPASRDWLSL